MMDPSVKIALAGDTMLGRKVAEAIERAPVDSLVSPEVVSAAREADLFVLNLECCISERGERWPDPAKPFFFRAPPRAVELLRLLEVDCVTLANNHALDFGTVALRDTLEHLALGGIAVVGAGRDLEEARRPALLESGAFTLKVIGFTDHPAEFAAAPDRPGVAYADLRRGVPGWVVDAIRMEGADAVLVTPHWGPNMTPRPVPRVRTAAGELVAAGATLVAGHSAHVFHGVADRIIYDLGDFLDDYAVDPVLRNDRGILLLVDLSARGPTRIEALPLALDFCHTRVARDDEAAWIADRLRSACEELGTDVRREGDRLVIEV